MFCEPINTMSEHTSTQIQPLWLNCTHCAECSFVARSPPCVSALLLVLAFLCAPALLLECMLSPFCSSAYACPSQGWLSASALLLGHLPLSLSLVVAACCQGCSAPVASHCLLNQAVLYLMWMEDGHTCQQSVGPPCSLLTCGCMVTLLASSGHRLFSSPWFTITGQKAEANNLLFMLSLLLLLP